MSGSVILTAVHDGKIIGSRSMCYQAAVLITQLTRKYLTATILINSDSSQYNISDITLTMITSPKIVYSYDDFVDTGLIVPGTTINDIVKILLNYYIETFCITIPSVEALVESKTMIEICTYLQQDTPVIKMSQINFTLETNVKSYKLVDHTRLDLNLMFVYYVTAIRDRKIYTYSKHKLEPTDSYNIMCPSHTEDRYLIYTDLNNIIVISNHDIYYSCFVLHRSDNCIIYLNQQFYTLPDSLHVIRMCFKNSSIFDQLTYIPDGVSWYKPKSWRPLPHGYHLSGISSELLIEKPDITLMTKGFYTYYYYKLTPESSKFSGHTRAVLVDTVRKYLDDYYFMPWQHTTSV